MTITHISNGNTTFGIRNGIEPGTWGSAGFFAMLHTDRDRAELRTSAHGSHAEFSKSQIQTIARCLLELAADMPEDQ